MQREIYESVLRGEIHRRAKSERTQKCWARNRNAESPAASQNHSAVWCVRVQQNGLRCPGTVSLMNHQVYSSFIRPLFSCRIDGGELFDRVLDDKFILTEKACAIFMRQICEAMDYIHEHNIIHLDLKVSQLRDYRRVAWCLMGVEGMWSHWAGDLLAEKIWSDD